MRVYAESNFVLEIVLQQEQSQACDEILRLAASHSIELVLPAFALLEPYQTLVRRERDDGELSRRLRDRAKQLSRTASMAGETPGIAASADLLVRAGQDAAVRFRETRRRLLEVARMVAVDRRTLIDCSVLAEEYGLELPDALVLASVLSDASAYPRASVFLNRNARDFDDPDIKARLRQLGCDLLGSFDDGLSRVMHALQPEQS